MDLHTMLLHNTLMVQQDQLSLILAKIKELDIIIYSVLQYNTLMLYTQVKSNTFHTQFIILN